MKRHKILLISLALLLSLSLTGCIEEYQMTDQQRDAIAEYMAGKLLQYDENYEQALIPEGELDEDGTNSESTSEAEDNTDAIDQNTTINDYTLSDIIGVEGFTVQYSSYKLVASYSENPDSFSLDPADGYQLLVASFILKNKAKTDKGINLIKSGITYRLDVNNGTTYDPILTLLENDLQYIDINVAAGKSKKVLLIFEVPKDLNVANIALVAAKGNKTVSIEVK